MADLEQSKYQVGFAHYGRWKVAHGYPDIELRVEAERVREDS